MSTVAAPIHASVTPGDRLGLTLCLAIILHGIIILGVTFAPEEMIKPRYESMEIILVQQESKAPEDAEFLAQANLEGGGDVEEKVSPSTPLPAPFPDQTPEDTPPPPQEMQPPAEPEAPSVETIEPEPVQTPSEAEELLTAMSSEADQQLVEKFLKEEVAEKTTENISEKKPVEKTEQKQSVPEAVETPPLPSATALLTNSFKIAALSAEIRRKQEAKAKRPRRKFISASTKEYKYAAYMEAWRAKVERVGNLNYPEVARKRKLSGSLILAVDLNQDGSINQVLVRKSSGHKVLDDAAIRIVELAAPYAPFPEQIKKETDILSIVRTWQFINNSFKRK